MADTNAADSAGSGAGAGISMRWAMNSARRRAIRQGMQNLNLPRMAHGMVHAPMINHPKSGLSGMRFGSQNAAPKFGTGGGFKAGGF